MTETGHVDDRGAAAPPPTRTRTLGVDTVAVDGYRDFEVIGTGGFSTVYRAYQEVYDRVVAVKVMTAELDDDVQRRFLRECALTGRLTGHPNVVTILDSGITGSRRPFITTDYYARGSLAQVVREDGPLDVRAALAIGVKIAGALETAHRSGIHHRDVKPQNILLSAFGEPALGDFGISRAVLDRETTMAYAGLTMVHAPPEALEGDTRSPTADTYSLASTLYWVLAGSAPFATESGSTRDGVARLLRRILTAPLPSFDRGDVPEAVVEILRRAMAKEANERYPTPVAFGEALQRVEQALYGICTPAICPPPDDPWELPHGQDLASDQARRDRAAPAGLAAVQAGRPGDEGRLVVSLDDAGAATGQDPLEDGGQRARLVIDLGGLPGHVVDPEITAPGPRRPRA